MNDQELIDQLLLESLELSPGCSVRLQCPKCMAEDEKSLKVTKHQTGISWKCFRAKCQWRGATTQKWEMTGSTSTTTQDVYPSLSPLTCHTRAMTAAKCAYVKKKWGLSDDEIRYNLFKATEERQPRLVMPIFDCNGEVVGNVTKRIVGSGAKARSHWHKQRPGMHYPRCAISGGPVALTEDTLSSIRVARYVRSRALLGVYLSDVCIEQLRKETDTILLALDNDVVDLMVRLADKLRGLFTVYIIVWPKDPKNLDDITVSNILEKYL